MSFVVLYITIYIVHVVYMQVICFELENPIINVSFSLSVLDGSYEQV